MAELLCRATLLDIHTVRIADRDTDFAPVGSSLSQQIRLGSQRSAFDRVGDALRGDGNGPDDDDGPAGVLVAV